MLRFIKIAILTMIFSFATGTALGQFVQNSSRSLFSDVKAFRIGDAIMVLIAEETSADNSATTADSRSTDMDGGVKFGTRGSASEVNVGIGTGNTFRGQGQTARKEKIRSKLSARVDSVDANGNLFISGTRTTKVNGETQTIVIQGLVRPVDVSPTNSVYSYSILNLTLFIEGDGSVSKVQEPGLITKFIRLLF